MDAASLTLLATSGALDEISNADDGSAIERRLLMAGSTGGHVKDGATRKAVLFVIYETGRHGPQSGYRLALVLGGAKVEEARKRLKGRVEERVREFVVVGSGVLGGGCMMR